MRERDRLEIQHSFHMEDPARPRIHHESQGAIGHGIVVRIEIRSYIWYPERPLPALANIQACAHIIEGDPFLERGRDRA